MGEDEDPNFGYGEEDMEGLDMQPGLVGMGEDGGEDDGEEGLDMGEDEPQLIDEEQFM